MKSPPARTFGRLAAIAALPLALAACQGEEKPAEAKTAQGEILGGSASDAMLPLDTVRSQPPLAPEATETAKPGKGGKRSEAANEAGDTASEAAPAAAAAPEPAAASAVPKPGQ